jgi:hypothetical protein
MAQRLKYFLVVLLLMLFTGEIFAQNEIVKNKTLINLPDTLLHVKKTSTRWKSLLDKPPFTLASVSCTPPKLSYIQETNILFDSMQLKSSYIKTLGVICKVEYKFEKVTLIPLRLRVGSLDYTNYLEQKPNALKPSY